MKLIFNNKTSFTDDCLRRLVVLACQHVGLVGAELTLEVWLTHTRKSHVSGRATIGPRPGARDALGEVPRFRRAQYSLVIPKLPNPCTNDFYAELRRELIAVAIHEAMHLRGSRHRDMTQQQLECSGPIPQAFENWFLVLAEVAEPKPDPVAKTAARRAVKLDHVRIMHRKATTRLKRATTIERKWRQKLRRLERSEP